MNQNLNASDYVLRPNHEIKRRLQQHHNRQVAATTKRGMIAQAWAAIQNFFHN